MTIDEPITLEQQVDMMKKYVKFVKRVRIRKFLKYTGYFRASRYGKYLLALSNIFQEKPSHELLYEVYQFDVELRNLFFKYCKKAEIQFKTNNATFYLDKDIYTPSKGEKDKKTRDKNKKYFDRMLGKIKQDEGKLRKNNLKYPDLNEYRDTGGRRANKIPAWAFFSYIEIGEFINIYSYLNLKYQKAVLQYGYSRNEYSKDIAKNVDTWLNAIRNLRNICAHHSKLVGLQAAEIAVESCDDEDLLISKEDLLSRMYALKKILRFEDAEQLKKDMNRLIRNTEIEIYKMGILPEDWEDRYVRIKKL